MRLARLLLAALAALISAAALTWWDTIKDLLLDYALRKAGLSPNGLTADVLVGVGIPLIPIAFMVWLLWPEINRRVLRPTSAKPEAREWLHPRDAYERLGDCKLVRAWRKALVERDRANAAADAIAAAGLPSAGPRQPDRTPGRCSPMLT